MSCRALLSILWYLFIINFQWLTNKIWEWDKKSQTNILCDIFENEIVCHYCFQPRLYVRYSWKLVPASLQLSYYSSSLHILASEKRHGWLATRGYSFKGHGENLNWEWVGTTVDSEMLYITSKVISHANTKVGLILYLQWITSLSSPISHRDGDFVWGWFFG